MVTLKDVILCCQFTYTHFLQNCRIHPAEHFKKKYEVDEVFFTDEVCAHFLTVIARIHILTNDSCHLTCTHSSHNIPIMRCSKRANLNFHLAPSNSP